MGIIGLGGIGSWVAVNMALIGVKKIVIIDNDIIENHNLNRTLFRQEDIGEFKTSAVMDLIYERREDIQIRAFNKRLEDLTEFELSEFDNCLILDCRDNLKELPTRIRKNQRMKLGYDGLSVTIILNPKYGSVLKLDDVNGYRVIPSFLGSCQFLANWVTLKITDKDFNLDNESEHKIMTFNLVEKMKELIK